MRGSRGTLLTGIAAVAALALGGYAVFANDPVARDSAAPDTDAQGWRVALEQQQQAIRSLEHNVRLLSAELLQVRGALAAAELATSRPAEAVPLASVESTPSLPPAPEAVQTRADLDKQLDSMQARFESLLQQGEPDLQQAQDLQIQFGADLQAAGFVGTQLVDVACETRVCRLHLRNADDDASEAFLADSARVETLRDATFYYTRSEEPDGSVSLTLYLSREG